MLGTYKVRRMAALLAIASVTNGAGFLAAQRPALKPPTGAKNPTRISVSDCDWTQGTCGDGNGGALGSGTYGGGSSGGDGNYGSSGSEGGLDGGGYGGEDYDRPPTCSSGSRVPCGRDSSYACTQWMVTDASGQVTFTTGLTPSGTVKAGVTRTCVGYLVSIRILTWSR